MEPTPIFPSKPKNTIVIFLSVISLILLAATAFFAYQKNQLINRLTLLEASLSQPTPIPNPTVPVDWQTVTSDLYGFQIKIPSSWREVEHSSNFQNLFPYQAPDQSQLQLIITDTTEKSLTDYLAKYDSESSTSWEGRPSKMVLASKAASVGVHPAIERKEDWLAADFTTTVTYALVGDRIYMFSIIPASGATSREDIPIEDSQAFANYHQILSTFKYQEPTTATPTISAKKLTYLLPNNWKTVQDKTKTFEVGYNPTTELITDASINDLRLGFQKTGQFGGSSYSVSIEPYDGGSRHKFILGENAIQEQDKLPGYHEKNYTYNDRSCLVIHGVGISQWPTTQGMCDIDGKRAFRFGAWADEANTEKIIQTIRLLK